MCEFLTSILKILIQQSSYFWNYWSLQMLAMVCNSTIGFYYLLILLIIGAIELTLNQVILNALSPVVCFDVILSTMINDAFTSFTIQLMMPLNQNINYNIRFRQQFIVIDILRQQPVTMTTTCKYHMHGR